MPLGCFGRSRHRKNEKQELQMGLEITQNCREYFQLENLFYLVNDDLNIHEFIFRPLDLSRKRNVLKQKTRKSISRINKIIGPFIICGRITELIFL